MMHQRVVSILVYFAGGLAIATPANAQLKNNSDGWPQMKVGNKICFVSHAHFGQSPSWPSKEGAKAYAIREWERFTTWEYGANWGHYKTDIPQVGRCKSDFRC